MARDIAAQRRENAAEEVLGAELGGVQVVTLLGPFRVTAASPGLDSNSGHVIEEAVVPAGTVVIRAWAVVQDILSGWTAGEDAPLRIMLAPDSDTEDTWTVQEYHPPPGPTARIVDQGSAKVLMEAVGLNRPIPEEWVSRVGIAVEDAHLAVYSSGPVSGEADIFAIIAEQG